MGARLGAVSGAILAGGRAERLGGAAKGLLDVGGTRIIDRVAAALREVAGEIVIASNSGDAGAWVPEARVARDVLTGGGSAAGVHAALVATSGPVIVVAWDMPFVTPAFLAALAERGGASGGDAFVPVGVRNGDLEPACAWYAPPFAEAIERAWRKGERSLHCILRTVRAGFLEAREVAAIGDPARLFFNVNTAEDLARARHLAADG